MKKPIFELPLKIVRKIYALIHPNTSNFGRNWKIFSNKEYANDLIYKMLMNDNPCMIARFGSTELQMTTNYKGVKYPEKYKNIKTYIQGSTPAWWFESNKIQLLQTNSGFFPNDLTNVRLFCELILNDIPQIDILGSWLLEENFYTHELKNAKRVVLEDMEPFFSTNPWTKALEGKKVLVVHPFASSIEQQYDKRELLFENNLLPKFELKTIQAVQSIAGTKTDFSDWFQALEAMKAKIDSIEYDICIIGCGAYGMPLAAHVKRKGKKAIHMAGVTQLLFGIKGNRWEQYVVWPYMNLFNEHWIRPGENEKPEGAHKIEGACYW